MKFFYKLLWRLGNVTIARCNAIVARDDDTGTVTARGCYGTVGLRAANQESISNLNLIRVI
ncbi:hypothetical protein PanWU01x14_370790, partial [Parasponia andersonii]